MAENQSVFLKLLFLNSFLQEFVNLNLELDAENRRLSDAQKGLRKYEQKIKELTYQQDEDRKNHERMQGLIDQLQGKIRSYKKLIEEAEEMATLNLAKFKQT